MGVFGIMDVIVADNSEKNMNAKLVIDDKIVECADAADTEIANDGREEGEIVDEFELILSSEGEEYTVRERIRELEATNNELEQIAKISGADANEYSYYPGFNSQNRFPPNKHFEPDVHVLSDLSSISSGEFQTPKKKKRHKGKKSKNKHGEQDSRRDHSTSRHRGKRREHHHRSDRKKRREGYLWRQEKPNEAKLETILLDSYDSFSDEQTRCENDYEASDEIMTNSIIRERLRFALAHDTKREVPMGSLRERLKNKSLTPPKQINTQESEQDHKQDALDVINETFGQAKCITIESESSDTDDENENELRLIALKSAILNKHQQRKKRNAEMAYSPTDFIEDEQFKNAQDSDIDDFMEISPAESPVRVISPFEEASVDTKPIDMELETSDSDCDDITNNNNKFEDQWTSLNVQNPMNNFNQIFRFGQYLDLSSFAQLQNMDDKNPTPLPPPYILPEEHLDENISNNSYCLNSHRRNSCTDIQSISMENIEDFSNEPAINDSMSDEEEKALRALLLSKCKTKKPSISHSPTRNDQITQNTVSEKTHQTHKNEPADDENEDPEALRSLLLNNMKMKKKTQNECTPFILKEAVRRFQLKSLEDQQHEDATLVHNAIDTKYPSPTPSDNGKGIDASENKTTNISVKATLRDEILQSTPDIDEQSNSEKSVDQIENVSVATKENATKLNDINQHNDINVLKIQPDLCNANSKLPNTSATLEKKSAQKITNLAPSLGILTKTTNVLSSKPPPKLNGIITNATTIKIVKPNKVINKNAVMKRKAVVTNTSQQPPKKAKPTLLMESSSVKAVQTKESDSTYSSRFLTKADLSSLKVNKLIITLGSNESDSDDSWLLEDTSNSLPFESLAMSYSDNASPISLPMESPCETPTRSNTPNVELVEPAAPSVTNLRKSVINDFFEKKIDDFLKQARSKVHKLTDEPTQQQIEDDIVIKSTEQVLPKKSNEKISLATPVAVRHLPASSQAEYRRLIERMRMLEKRKESRVKDSTPMQNKDVATVDSKKLKQTHEQTSTGSFPPKMKTTLVTSPIDLPTKTNISSSIPLQTKITSKSQNEPNVDSKCVSRLTTTSSKTQKSPLAVSIKAASLTPTPKEYKTLTTTTNPSSLNINEDNESSLNKPSDLQIHTTPSGMLSSSLPVRQADTFSLPSSSLSKPQPAKGNAETLSELETSYYKIGAAMITHLNKSLVMVEEAKLTKIARIRYRQRLKELLAEVNEVKSKIRLEQVKISKIHPKIQQSHDMITQLKERRNKIFIAAMELGKGTDGDTAEYRLKSDEAKIEITKKSTQLTEQIRFVNSLNTFNDLKKLESTTSLSPEKPALQNEITQIFNNVINDHVATNVNNQTQVLAVPSVSLTVAPKISSQESSVADKQHFDSKKNDGMRKENCDTKCVEVLVQASDKQKTRNIDTSLTSTIDETQQRYNDIINAAVSSNNIIEKPQEPQPTLQQPVAINDSAAENVLEQPATKAPETNVPEEQSNTRPRLTSAKTSPALRRAVIFEELEKKTEYTEPCFQILRNEPKAIHRNVHEDYHSPLESLRGSESRVDPQSLVCPYDLMGNCQDTDCPFLHLSKLPPVSDQLSTATLEK